MLHNQILKQYFGYDSFRKGQERLIDSILSGRDVLGIMPTGAGKSICFQVPALMLEGITLIISPLISLMKDQVNTLTQAGIPAAFINSSLSERQIDTALSKARNGAYKLIYIAPERLLSQAFLDFAECGKISMLTVDEAHCISQWGQDFRPSYARIPEFIEKLSRRPILSAFTATATARVREDIVELLSLQSPDILVTGFDRSNLYFEVQKPRNKFGAILEFLKDKKDKCGIVYCSTRNAVEEVCEKLIAAEYNASRYHAGLSDRERQGNQEDFLYDRAQIMVATNAFGMGIDKSNVSFVVHYNMPKDIESYYQEAGRAGRDGEPADCVILYNAQDVRTHTWLIDNARDAEHQNEEAKERERRRLKEMTFYCTTCDCLRSYILKYFGETPPNFCGNCSSCNTNFESADITVDAQKILSCVIRTKERYGATMIIDILRGSKNEKVIRSGLDKLSTYGISEKSDKQLRDIINHLVQTGFLIKTDTEYPTIKIGERAGAVLHGGETIAMKLSKEQTQLPKRMLEIKPINKALFAVLRKLRQEIANEQNVPAFVIFSDSTLTDMCMKLPQNPQEMLAVSGVGQVKLEKYGVRFQEAITGHLQSNPITEDDEVPAALPPFDKDDIELSEDDVLVGFVADKINSVLMQSGEKRVSRRKINDWLVSMGYLELVLQNGKNYKIPTAKGMELGITSQCRPIRGSQTIVNLFSKAAQEFVVEHLQEIMPQ